MSERRSDRKCCYECKHYIPDEKDKFMGECGAKGIKLNTYLHKSPLSYRCKQHFERREGMK